MQRAGFYSVANKSKTKCLAIIIIIISKFYHSSLLRDFSTNIISVNNKKLWKTKLPVFRVSVEMKSQPLRRQGYEESTIQPLTAPTWRRLHHLGLHIGFQQIMFTFNLPPQFSFYHSHTFRNSIKDKSSYYWAWLHDFLCDLKRLFFREISF